MNVNGRLGADAIQRMQQAQQQNAAQVDNQETEVSQTTRKPVSKSELVNLIKGKAGEPTSNVNTENATTQEAQVTNDNNEPEVLRKQVHNYGDLVDGDFGDFCLSIVDGQYIVYYNGMDGNIYYEYVSQEMFDRLKNYDGLYGFTPDA